MVFNQNIELGTLDDSDILLESMFGKETYLYKKKWAYTFCFIGEADRRIPDIMKNKMFKDYSCVLKGELSHDNIVNFPLFVFYLYSFQFVHNFKNNEKIITIPKKNVCAIITNGKDSEGRNYFLNELEKRVSIDYAGNYKNNVKRIEPAHCTKEFNEYVSQYKIIFSMENSKNKEYITEKILHGYNCNNIPIYWGSDSVSKYFNEERFINVKGFDKTSINESIDKIEEVLNNDDKFLEMVNKPIYKDNYVPLTLTTIASDIQKVLQIKNTQVKKFITFGNKPYYNNVIRICEESKNMRCFNEIYGYTDKYLKNDTEFWKKHGDFIEKNTSGYGNKIWKPYLIKKEMDKSKENDIIFYCDAGFEVNEKGKHRLHEYVDMLNTSDSGMITFQLSHTEIDKDTLECLTNVIIIKKNNNSTNIINQWYETYLVNHETENENEQTILSVILNKMDTIKDTIKIKNEIYFSDRTICEEYPFLKIKI
jgi:hypothetical protein